MLVLRPGALGDTLLAVPALRAIRRAFRPLRLAAHGPTARLLASLGEVDQGLAFDDLSLTWIFNADAPPDEPIVAWMDPAPGLASAAVVASSRPNDEQHVAHYLLRTLAPLGIDLTWDDQPLEVKPTCSDEILVHPGSGSNAKNWPSERFAAVIRALDGPVRLVVGEADVEAARQVAVAVYRLEQPPLEELAARLAGCRAYLGNDSGVSHLAGLLGARTFAMFGPTNPNVWRPIGPDVHVLPFDTNPSEVARLLAG